MIIGTSIRKWNIVTKSTCISFFPLFQIIGLTASLGVGGNTDPKAAMKHMENLLINLDSAALCTVRRNKEELKKIENRAKERKRINISS